MSGKQAIHALRRPSAEIRGAGARVPGTRDYDVLNSTSRRGQVYEKAQAPTLSPREIEVLSWLARGKSGPEIAIILGISTCTVRIHIQSTKRKLNASNIPHAVYQGFLLGILYASLI